MSSIEQIATVRRFNRAWTEVTALLDDSYLETGLTLPEARLVYEVAQASPLPIVELRTRLKLDPGYTTRLLDRLAERKLITREVDAGDRRRQLVAITDAGRAAFAQLTSRADSRAEELIAPLDPDVREALVDALSSVEELMGAQKPIQIRPADVGELGWVLQRHGQIYEQEYGWPGFEAEVARIVVVLLTDPKSRVWVAERNGRLLGSVACAEDSPDTARLRLLLVEPAARGHGLGARLVDECLAFARQEGYQRIVLHTQDALLAARRLYAARGFQLDHASAEDSLDPNGKGEHWSLDLD